MGTRDKIMVLAVGGALAALLTGCGAPQLLSLTQACAADKDGSSVAVEGFLRADTAVSCNSYGGDYRCSLDAVENPTGDGAPKAGLEKL